MPRLRRSFLDRLADRLDIMERNYKLIHSDELCNSALAVIRAEAHKISGTAKIFGFVELGNISREVDLQIGMYFDQQQDGHPLETVRVAVSQLLETCLQVNSQQ